MAARRLQLPRLLSFVKVGFAGASAPAFFKGAR